MNNENKKIIGYDPQTGQPIYETQNVQQPQAVTPKPDLMAPAGSQLNNQQNIQSQKVQSQVQQTNTIEQINNQQTTQNYNFTQAPASNYTSVKPDMMCSSSSKSNNNKMPLLIGIVCLVVVLLGVGVFTLINNNSPKNVYRSLIKKGISEVFDVTMQNDDKSSSTVNLDLDLKLEEEMVDNEILDLINKTTLGLNYQIDKDNKQLVIKIDSDYEKDSLLDLQLFVDSKNSKTYLYAKDYYDKYLEVEMDDYSSFSELFESNELTIGQTINAKKAEKLITKELVNIVTSEDCSKEDGKLVFKITEKELLTRIKTAISNLRDNQKFLDCYEEPDKIKAGLDGMVEGIDVSMASDEIYKVSIKKKALSNKIESATVNYMETELNFVNDKDQTNYTVKEAKEIMVEGYIKNKVDKKVNKIELLVKVPEMGQITLNLDTAYEKVKEIDKVDSSNIKDMNELTEAEQTAIMEKLEDSKLYELINTFAGGLMGGSDDWEDDYDYDYDYDLNEDETNTDSSVPVSELTLYNGKKVNFNIPSDLKNTYNSDTYKTFEKDSIEVLIKASPYSSINEYLTGNITSFCDLGGYENCSASERKSIKVDGKTYYYEDRYYEYNGFSTTKWYEKKIWGDLGGSGDNYFIVEITSEDVAIDDNLVKKLLSVK